MGCGGGVKAPPPAPAQETWNDPVQPLFEEHLSLGGGWQLEESPGSWRPFSAEVSAQLLVAWYCRESHVEYVEGETTYLVDFEALVQMNRTTGAQQRIGWLAGSGQEEEREEEQPQAQHLGEAGEDLEDRLIAAFATGWSVVYYSAYGCEFEVDFANMVQTNLTTGEEFEVGLESSEDAMQGHWVEYSDPETGRPYYSNGKITTWDKPAQLAEQAAASWTEYLDLASGRPYWSNGVTTTWERPAILSPVQAQVQQPQPQHQHQPQQQPQQQAQQAQQQQQQQQAQQARHEEQKVTGGGEAQGPRKRKKHTLGKDQEAWCVPEAPTAAPGQEPAMAPPMAPTLNAQQPHWHPMSGLPQPAPAPPREREATVSQSIPRMSQPYSFAPSREETAPAARPGPPGAPGPPKPGAAGKTGRPRVHIFKATPEMMNANRQPRQNKKWTIGPEQRRDKTQVKGSTAASVKQQAAARQRAAAAGSRRPPRGEQAGPSAEGQELPKGCEWPSDKVARKVAQALFRDMERSRKKPLEQRQKAYRASCLSWHPDKNPKHQAMATQVFQFLQLLKNWYFED